MRLDYRESQAQIQAEIQGLGRRRERYANMIAEVDRRVRALIEASKALARAGASEPDQVAPAPLSTPPLSAPPEETDLAAAIQDLLRCTPEGLTAPDIKNALVASYYNWKARGGVRPFAVVRAVLKRLVKNGDVQVKQSAAGELYYDESSLAEKGREEQQRRARAREKREARKQEAAERVDINPKIADACREILLRFHPKGRTANELAQELKRSGMNIRVWYARPATGIFRALKDCPWVRMSRVEREAGTRMLYRLVEAKDGSGEAAV